jgi:hypothetical protein
VRRQRDLAHPTSRCSAGGSKNLILSGTNSVPNMSGRSCFNATQKPPWIFSPAPPSRFPHFWQLSPPSPLQVPLATSIFLENPVARSWLLLASWLLRHLTLELLSTSWLFKLHSPPILECHAGYILPHRECCRPLSALHFLCHGYSVHAYSRFCSSLRVSLLNCQRKTPQYR